MPSEAKRTFYTRAELADELRMSLPTLDRKIKSKQIYAVKSGRAKGSTVTIPRESYYAAIEARRRGEL